MTSIVSLLLVILLAILTQRVASTALRLTGVSQELASFQARSALTGVGFTTKEAEAVTGHPVRRRIVSTLMLLGSAGVITAIASLILSFVDVEAGRQWIRVLVLATGVALLWLLARSSWLERRLDAVITRALDRWTEIRVRDYVDMLHLTDDFKVVELQVKDESDWLAERTLDELNVDREGVNVLGITRADGHYVGAPGSDTAIQVGDRLLLYGRLEVLQELDERRKGVEGEAEHSSSVRREEGRRREEAMRHDEARRTRGRRDRRPGKQA